MPDSEPTTPLSEHKQAYLPPWVDDAEDEDNPKVKRSGSLRKGETSPQHSSPLRTGGSAGESGGSDEQSGVSSPVRRDSLSSSSRLPRRRIPNRSLSGSPEEDHDQLPSWIAAQEEESRAKSMWVDEDSGNIHQ